MVEIKEEGIEEKVLKEVKKSRIKNVMIISFLENALRRVNSAGVSGVLLEGV